MDLDQKNRVNALLGFYGPLLTTKQQDYLAYYCADDYSIIEIAQEESCSRQAVSENIKRGVEQLERYENLLHIYRDFLKRQELEKEVIAYLDEHHQDDQNLKKMLEGLLSQEID
ncbi:DNA-binding protein [Eupransor demetentiae]|uniref:UPF0122 protein R54876_GBNLAHCA_00249 n=1 Tax=Eupransor demetentiae TaxID=3109584 RepID=A0ABM9N3I0_9LACO|nr:Predicted DNA-binding protein YlxM [Lactobacillaceae bacterium LMG 33000]